MLLGGMHSLPLPFHSSLGRLLVGLFLSSLHPEFCRMSSVKSCLNRTCDWRHRAASQAMLCVQVGSGCEFGCFPPDTECRRCLLAMSISFEEPPCLVRAWESTVSCSHGPSIYLFTNIYWTITMWLALFWIPRMGSEQGQVLSLLWLPF